MRPLARTPTTHLILVTAIIILSLGNGAVTALDASLVAGGLFLDSSLAGTLGVTDNPTVTRYRYADVVFDELIREDGSPKSTQPGYSLILNLFDDAVHTALLDRVEYISGRDFAWLGHLEGEPYSQVVFVVGDGVLVGNISTPGAFFQVRYAGNGVHAISEIDQSGFPPELPPVPAPVGAADVASSLSVAEDEQPRIDVLVVYTARARTAAGGSKRMRELIYLAVAETNQSYENSHLDQHLNLVHYEEVEYEEESFPEALSHLTHPSDGVMDNVHELREQYAADAVVLLIEDFTACGYAFQMMEVSPDFEIFAFAVVNQICATGNYSFGHELGHLMGAQHDWYRYLKAYESPPALPYGFGYVNASAGWRTVMASNTECQDRDLECVRLPYWSNPDITLDGEPMGVPEGTSTSCVPGEYDPNCDADNRKTLDATAATVAGFRSSTLFPSAPTDLFATVVSPTRVDLTWTDNCYQETGFSIERSPNGVSDWAQIGTVKTDVTSYSDTEVVPEAAYYYRVQTYNDLGVSAYSNVASAMTPTSTVGPLVYQDQVVDDDRRGASDGDFSGYVDCGETIELEVSLMNEGSTAVSGIVADLVVDDPHVVWTGNMESTYPLIEGQDSEYNKDEFEFQVAPDTPNGHVIHFDLGIVADNWGPGSTGLDVTVFCSASAQHRVFLPVVIR
jgi:hypothetical protein